MPTLIASLAIAADLQKLQRRQSRPKAACLAFPAGLALGELLAPPRLVQAYFLAFDLARVTRHKPRFLQRGLQRLVVIDQCAGDTVAHRAGLARLAAAGHV